MAKRAIICDLDGTLAIPNGRNVYNGKACGSDLLNLAVVTVLRLAANAGHSIILSSGRSDNSLKETKYWLAINQAPYHYLFMRQTGDRRQDAIIKAEMYRDKIVPLGYEILFAMDDRNQVCDLWRWFGLTCFQVAPGNF